MSRHFCCCIPVRAGVFIFSLISFLASTALAVLAWIATYKVHHDPGQHMNISNTAKIIIIVVGSISTLIALISLFGWIGSITRNRRFVKAYSALSWVIFLLSLVSAGFFLYIVYAGKALYDCISVDSNLHVDTNVSCDFHFSLGIKILVTVITVLQILIHLYIVVIIRRYVDQLEDGDESWRSPYTLGLVDPRQGLLNPASEAYPYSDATHAFGKAAEA
ncbi:hypothetical protein BKA93DRAFT_830112 [Sparassis latifolia]|uniref:Uncharacterized protein n=1 Tax=Sparassis crispa TaxID=139825 RepID=A0A401GU43_9APHY|nr:predicted protein [Sparassis crispa]GBE85699.1 predicted protein [Sparassis crispa]